MVTVNFGREKFDKSVTVTMPARAEVEKLRIV